MFSLLNSSFQLQLFNLNEKRVEIQRKTQNPSCVWLFCGAVLNPVGEGVGLHSWALYQNFSHPLVDILKYIREGSVFRRPCKHTCYSRWERMPPEVQQRYCSWSSTHSLCGWWCTSEALQGIRSASHRSLAASWHSHWKKYSHFIRLNWLPPFLCRYPAVETPPGMVRRFWAPMARIGMGQHTSGDDMVLKREKKRSLSLWSPTSAIVCSIRKVFPSGF